MKKIGALEAGGTKMVLATYNTDGEMINTKTFPTITPEETMPQIVEYFINNNVDCIGIGSFGPLELNKNSEKYGYITSTPKLAWRNYPLVGDIQKAINVPCAIDTDVNTAVLAESKLGVAKGLSDVVYVTIGTGVGGGVLSAGNLVHGMMHPELGHMLLRPHPTDPIPKGVCPYHDGCLEGLASGSALNKRADGKAKQLPSDSPYLDLQAHYLAQMCVNLILILSPQKIILGGGVMQRKELFSAIQLKTKQMLGGYINCKQITENIDEMIVSPSLYPISGLVGAYLIGKELLA